ncbi:MAG: thioredoxin, partial [Chitinophagaceae bacterium]
PTFAAFEQGILVDQVQTNKVEGLTELFSKIK